MTLQLLPPNLDMVAVGGSIPLAPTRIFISFSVLCALCRLWLLFRTPPRPEQDKTLSRREAHSYDGPASNAAAVIFPA
jgi:hypothetical protein